MEDRDSFKLSIYELHYKTNFISLVYVLVLFPGLICSNLMFSHNRWLYLEVYWMFHEKSLKSLTYFCTNVRRFGISKRKDSDCLKVRRVKIISFYSSLLLFLLSLLFNSSSSCSSLPLTSCFSIFQFLRLLSDLESKQTCHGLTALNILENLVQFEIQF